MHSVLQDICVPTRGHRLEKAPDAYLRATLLEVTVQRSMRAGDHPRSIKENAGCVQMRPL